MAAKKKSAGQKKRFIVFKKICAGFAMMAFMVVAICGIRADVSLNTIAYRATGVMFVIYVFSRIIMRILISYEEMNSGKA